MAEFHYASLKEAEQFALHERVDLVGILYFKGGQECTNETFSTLNFKMSISTLKFKFSIKFAFAIYLGDRK